jgi:hypothetical protein
LRSRINSTDRKKIDASMASFTIAERGDGLAEFQAWIDLESLKLPGEGEVIVEAYRQSLHERYDFGTVTRLAPREATLLRELGKDGIKFRIKVVEPGSGRLLARGDRLGAADDAETGRKELLKVVIDNLGQEPWKTKFYDDGLPVLVLNEDIPDALARIKSDPLFQALILPGALRQILLMLWREEAEEVDEDEDDENRWTTGWLRYARQLAGRDKPDWKEEDIVWIWIDDVCRAFSAHFGLLSKIAPED